MSERENYVHIGAIVKNSIDQVRVDLSEYMGKPLIDVRIYSNFLADGEPKPTKRGVSIQPAHLPELIKLLVAAEAKARELGILVDDPASGGE